MVVETAVKLFLMRQFGSLAQVPDGEYRVPLGRDRVQTQVLVKDGRILVRG